MPKIILDTNVLVSSLIQRSFPFLIVEEIFNNDHFQICLSDDLLKEYFEVLQREKFSKFPDFFLRAENFLVEIQSRAIHFSPKIKLDIISDVDDNRILELASEAKADFIITGNTNDFTFPKFQNTKIVTPKEFWENNLSQ